jgi:hypothetical protein
MSDRLLVATRKGLFVLQADGKGGWTLGEPHFIGEPVNMVLADRRNGRCMRRSISAISA